MFVISKTHVGMIRTLNEDTVLTEQNFFAIADGMGGYAAGETASSEVLKLLEKEAKSFAGLSDENLCSALENAVQKANKHVRQLAQQNEEYYKMGTTLVAVYITKTNKAYVVNVGDSRLYTWDNGKLEQVTNDHSYVAELLAKGEITQKEAFQHPQRNLILRAIGAEDEVEADIFTLTLTQTTKLLLCSDGLSDMVEDKQITTILAENTTAKAAELLLESALNNGGRDNISLIIVDLTPTEEDD